MISRRLLTRWLPLLAWPHVTPDKLRLDMIAAVTGAVIVLPQAIAFASIAGLPPAYGLYTAMVPAVVAALWGSSWHMVSGPTTAISIVVFASVSTMAEPGGEQYIGMVLTLTLLAGIIQLAMGLARLGALVNFISHTVVLGFTTGAACLIFASQIGNVLGLAVPRGLHFHQTILFALDHIRDTHIWVISVGVLTLMSGLLAKRYAPKLPYMIVAMVAGSILALLFNLLLGAGQTGIATIGTIQATFPPLSQPDFSYTAITSMLFPAFIVALLALTEALTISRSIALHSGQRIDSNQEFIGQGLSNIAGGFFSSYTASGSFNRTGVNYASGAQTPLAAAMSAVFLLAIAYFAAPLVSFLPVASVSAILFIVAWRLIDFKQIVQILRRQPQERFVLVVTFIGTLVDIEKGLFLGIVLSLVYYLHRTSQPSVEERTPPAGELANFGRKLVPATPDVPACPQMAILNVTGAIYFGAVEQVRDHLREVDEFQPNRKWVLLLARGVSFIDLAGAELLVHEARRRKSLGGGLLLVGAPPIVQQFLERGGQIVELGANRVVSHKGQALRAAYGLLDSDICRRCPNRVFQECQTHLPDGSPRQPDELTLHPQFSTPSQSRTDSHE